MPRRTVDQQERCRRIGRRLAPSGGDSTLDAICYVWGEAYSAALAELAKPGAPPGKRKRVLLALQTAKREIEAYLRAIQGDNREEAEGGD